MPRINAYNFRDDYRAPAPSMDPYRSAAREARYPEIETERVPSVHPSPSDLEPRVNRHVPSRAP